MFTLQSLPSLHGRCVPETSHKLRANFLYERKWGVHAQAKPTRKLHTLIHTHFLLSYFISDFIPSQSTAIYVQAGYLSLTAELCEVELNHIN